MKKKNCLKAYFLLLLFFVTSALFAIESVGRIVYLEGQVELQRDGETLELWDSDIGLDVFNYDLIETRGDGFVEIEIIGYKNRGTIIKVENDSAFYFDTSSPRDGMKMNVSLMAGSLAFKVQTLLSEENFGVRTESTVMGVRGTNFMVQRAPEGSVLLTCVEGKVSCEDDRKIERFAMPGSVVEKRPGSALSRIDIDVGDENLYGVYWKGKREEIFKAGAEAFIKGYSVQYANYLPRFLDAYENLLAVQDLMETYGHEEYQGGSFSSKLLTVKADVTDEIIMMRSIMFLFENCFYAVQVLEDYHDQGIGRTDLENGTSSDDFFRDFKRRKPEIKNKLANVRYCMKLYVNISKAASPGGGFGASSLFDDFITN